MENSGLEEVKDPLLDHHIQQELCTTRLPYRQGKKLTAVKAYSICNESQHLIVYGVPALKLQKELKELLKNYGAFNMEKCTNIATEQFTEAYHVCYERIQNARLAKKFLDTKNFYGGSLHVCYAPEYETVEETSHKINQRRIDVEYRLKKNEKDKKFDRTEIGDNLPKKIDSNFEQCVNRTEVDVCRKRPLQDGGFPSVAKIKKQTVDIVIEKQFEPTFVIDSVSSKKQGYTIIQPMKTECKSHKEFVPNLQFGNEEIRKLPEKKLNKIIFKVNKNS